VICAVWSDSLEGFGIERRGAHFRNDYPQHDDEHFRKHSVLTSEGAAGAMVFEQR
jgi:succinate dehydrogenase/fumarate reductase flavoprotein subunit